MPQVGDFYEAYRASEFVLVIKGMTSPGLTKVSGLSEGEIDTIEQPDGGTNRVYKLAATKIKYEPLTIERNVDGSPADEEFRSWVADTFSLGTTPQGNSRVRRSGVIEKRHNGKTVLVFSFVNAWIKSSKFTDLEAGSTGLLKQTIVLEHEGLTLEYKQP